MSDHTNEPTKHASYDHVQIEADRLPMPRRRRGWRIALGLLLLLAVGYGVLAYRYYSQEVRVTRNYSAELNAPILAIPEEQRAWTHYRRALMVLERRQEDEWAESPREKKKWPKTAAYLKRNAAAIEMIRQAAKIRPLGMLLQDGVPPEEIGWCVRHGLIPEDERGNVRPPNEIPVIIGLRDYEQTVTLFNLMNLLRADAYLAASEADSKRMVSDVTALLDFAVQVAAAPTISGRLNSNSVENAATTLVGNLLLDSPMQFTDEDLAQLSARFAVMHSAGPIRWRLDAARLEYDDLMQRHFTDDGQGNGFFALKPVEPEGPYSPDEGDIWRDVPVRLWNGIAAPIKGCLFTNTRLQTQERFDAWWAALEREAALPLWKRSVPPIGLLAESNPFFVALHQFSGDDVGLGFDTDWLDVPEHTTQIRDAAWVSVALVRYQRTHAAWPKALADLVPEFLPEIPADRFDGKPLRYRVNDGKPVLYSVGTNLADDGGVTSNDLYELASPSRWPPDARVPGDWVLWPAPESPVVEEDEAENDALPADPDEAPTDDEGVAE